MQYSNLARAFRKRMTETEVRMWVRLRRRQVMGYYFRRQVPVVTYVVDFLCSDARIVIEVDGAQHSTRRVYDAERTSFLEARGYFVIRFTNHEVFTNVDGVIETIAAHLQRAGRAS
ncbi:MAG: DUF559 domain-containing protein [Proteobacteria bacterium]|nr:DUF559 domain-containing protein [Pseudomonadota bacterium]MDA1057741.1 DUF559 domain-containing protein [Pseudomonadota bacterium]